MKRPLSLFLGSTALAAVLSLPAAAQEYSDGGSGAHDAHLSHLPGVAVGAQYSDGGCCAHDHCPAIITPVEAYGVHPPGDNCCRNGTITPYYAPLAPTPTCYRWRTTHYTPYYCGYCAHRRFGPTPPPYGCDGGWGPGPGPDHAPVGPGGAPLTYGPYTSVLQDDTTFWNMGGNGLVPYGTPRPPHVGPPDIVDMIQVSRGGGGHSHGTPDGAPVAVLSAGTAPAILPPAEKPAPAR